jgi:hypothetical protein
LILNVAEEGFAGNPPLPRQGRGIPLMEEDKGGENALPRMEQTGRLHLA